LSSLANFFKSFAHVANNHFLSTEGSVIELGSALLMLKKWADDEEVLLLCTVAFRDAGFSVAGRLSETSDGNWLVKSPKGEATLTFRVSSFDNFEYVERRALRPPDVEITEEVAERGALMIFFRPRFSLEEIKSEQVGERNSLRLMELLESEVRSGGKP
jgi:hypothetical protein